MALRLPEIPQRGRLHPSARKERKHTVKTTEDAFTRLTVAAAQARHSEIPKDRADAALTTLLGGLPPLPSGIEAMFATEYVGVPMSVISRGGRIASLGIRHDGSKHVVIIDADTRGMRVVEECSSTEHVDHPCFPEGSEEVAYVVSGKDGLRIIRWGDWSLSVPGDIGTISSIFFHEYVRKNCFVVHEDNGEYELVRFDESSQVPVGYDVRSPDLMVIGHFYGITVAQASVSERSKVVLLDYDGLVTWQSEPYDVIVEDSLMIRDGELSFVGWQAYGNGRCGVAHLVGASGVVKLGNCHKHWIHPLPSGQVLLETQQQSVSFERGAVKNKCFKLSDPLTGHTLTLRWTTDVHALVETDSLLALFTRDTNAPDGFIDHIHFIKKNEDGGWENRDSYTFIQGASSLLTNWDGKTLVIECESKGHRQLVALNWQKAEPWKGVLSGYLNMGRFCTSAPLYTPVECLAQTERGLMTWKFVNGTFYVIRYPW